MSDCRGRSNVGQSSGGVSPSPNRLNQSGQVQSATPSAAQIRGAATLALFPNWN